MFPALSSIHGLSTLVRIFYWPDNFPSVIVKSLSPRDLHFIKYRCPEETTNATTNHSNKHARPVGGDKVYIKGPSNTREESCGPSNIGRDRRMWMLVMWSTDAKFSCKLVIRPIAVLTKLRETAIYVVVVSGALSLQKATDGMHKVNCQHCFPSVLF